MTELTEICESIKNYFLHDKTSGTFELSSGSVPLDSLLGGQYFRIVGSVLNDGVYCNESESLAKLRPETFTGEIWSMAVPSDFIALCDEIAAWREKNEAADSVNMSPYTSESFGGYSYSKGGGSSSSVGTAVTWQRQFSSRLNAYRRISV